MRKFNAFAWGVLTGFALQMLSAEIVSQWQPFEPCEYVFPHSGKCTRRAHHAGNHW